MDLFWRHCIKWEPCLTCRSGVVMDWCTPEQRSKSQSLMGQGASASMHSTFSGCKVRDIGECKISKYRKEVMPSPSGGMITIAPFAEMCLISFFQSIHYTRRVNNGMLCGGAFNNSIEFCVPYAFHLMFWKDLYYCMSLHYFWRICSRFACTIASYCNASGVCRALFTVFNGLL